MATSVQFLNTALGSYSFGALFYDTSVHKSFKSLVRYSNTTHQAGVYGAHSVRCANVFCAPVLSLVESTGAILDDKHIERKTSAKPSTCQPPLVTSARNECLGYFYKGFLKNIL